MSDGKIVTASGEVYNPPLLLNSEEFEIVLRCFGLNRKAAVATRNRFSVGVVPKEHPSAVLLQSMSDKGIVRLELDASRLIQSRKWKGDMSKCDLVAHVTDFGRQCFLATISAAKDAGQRAQKAEARA